MRLSSNILFLLVTVLTLASSARAQDPSVAAYEDRIQAALAANPGGLTADQAAAAAARTAPSIDARSGEIALSKAGQSRTLARYVPTLNLSGSVTRNNPTDFDFGGGGLAVGALNPGQLQVGACQSGGGTNCIVDAAGLPVGAIAAEPFEIPRNNYALNAQLNVPISDYLLSLPSARRASKADLKGARFRRDFERERVELETRVAYFEWLRARAQVAVATESLVSVRARLADAKVGLELGTATPADVLQIESLEASSQVAIINASSFEELARTNLATQMGQTSIDFTVGEDVWAAPTAPSLTELETLVAHGQKMRSDVRALEQQRLSATEAAGGVNSQLYPRLDGFANLTHANPNQQFFPPSAEWNTSWSVGLRVSWGLDIFFQGRAQKNELLANESIFDAQLAATKRGARIEISSAYQEWQRAEKAVDFNQVDVAAAEAAYGQRVSLYKAGESTTSEVVEAELARFNASLRSINARINLHIALARLRRVAALDGKQPMGPPMPSKPAPVPSAPGAEVNR